MKTTKTPKTPCYFLTLNEGNPQFFYSDFSPIDPKEMHGLFAFIAYQTPTQQTLFVLCRFLKFQSNHAGVALLSKALTSMNPQRFFSKESHTQLIPFTKTAPIFGGEILLLQGQFVFWNFKSRVFSLDKPQYLDDNPELSQTIQACQLPPKCFIQASQADIFEKAIMRIHFEENGNYKDIQKAQSVVAEIGNELKFYHSLVSQERLEAVATEGSAVACVCSQ